MTPVEQQHTPEVKPDVHPMDSLLRMDRMPHIWCPGCGLGAVVNAFAAAMKQAGLNHDDVAVVSGIGCSGRIAGYIKLDSFHTTHGRAIPFATGLKLANPKLKVAVLSGDGDLISIGGNHFMHAARRNIDLTIVCVNNFIYAMTGGQVAPTSPLTANCSTSPYGNAEPPFNLPFIADSCGAVYVARWTTLHLRRAIKSITEALLKPGFTFVEIISPCVTLYGRRNRLGSGLDLMKYYREASEIRHWAPTSTLDIDFQGKLILGKFVDRERPTYLDTMNRHFKQSLGDEYVPWE